jgi:hypothetical protein
VLDAIGEISDWPFLADRKKSAPPRGRDDPLMSDIQRGKPVGLFPSSPAASSRKPSWPSDDFNAFHASDVPIRAGPKVGRNDPCPCGSGRKYKKCCEGKADQGP